MKLRASSPLTPATPTRDSISTAIEKRNLANITDILERRTITLTLRARPTSNQAQAAISDIVRIVYKAVGREQKASERYVASIGAIVGDLLRSASYEPLRPCYRPMAANDFINEPISHRPFKRAVEDLEAHGFIKRDIGKQAFDAEPGFVTRLYPTPCLTDHLFRNSIVAADCRNHFFYPRYADYARPVQLRRSSTRKDGVKTQGKRMKVDFDDPIVRAISTRMDAFNAFLSKQTITGPAEADLHDVALYRSYNHGQRKNHAYRLGGRMNPHGGGYYLLEHRETKQRDLIKINGEKTIEVDISACFLTLAYHLLRMQLPNPGDPYAGTDLPRPIVKAWINKTLSNHGFHEDWLSSVLDKLAKEEHFNVPETFPIKVVESKIRGAMPVIDKWMESHFTWANLHYEESEIMLAAMETLAFEHGIDSLPIHDALRVPESKRDIATQVIKSSFLVRTGLNPIIK